MNIVYALLISFFAGFSTLIGALFIFLPIKKQNVNKFITFSLAFSSAIMIGICITDLFPTSYFKLNNYYSNKTILIVIGLFTISYLLIKILNLFLNKYENKLYKLGILSMITLVLHNFPEGIITFLTSTTDIKLGIKLSLAIAMHNIPEGIAIAVPMYYATKSIKSTIIKTFVSGISEPLGAIIAYVFLSKFMTEQLLSQIMIIVCGLMITLAIEQMIPEAIKYKHKNFLKLGFICGVLVIIVGSLI